MEGSVRSRPGASAMGANVNGLICNVFSAEDEAKGVNMIRLCSEALVQAVAKCMVDA